MMTSLCLPTYTEEEHDDSLQPCWERDDWVPTLPSGKQRTPNMIRNELQKYIDNSSETQTAILDRMSVNNNSFRKFMNPKTYKDQWRACQYGTYWAAARLLEAERQKPKQQKSSAGTKRKGGATPLEDVTNNGVVVVAAAAPIKKKSKADVLDQIDKILAVEGVSESDPIFDTCPQMVKKIKDFLQEDGMTKAELCRALDHTNPGSLTKFLAGKQQDQAGNVTYKRAYKFLEQKRLLEGKKKSKARLKNETEQPPTGFRPQAPRKHTWYVVSAARSYY